MERGELRDRALVFCSRDICYQSGNFFAGQLAGAFEELGCEADLCELSEGDDLDERLEPFVGRPYRVIVDFNSRLPRMVMDDGTPYLDTLCGPFYDFLLDHPLFHHKGLSSGARNLRAIALDESHAAYLGRCYPSLAEARMLPLAATRAIGDGEKDGDGRILFPGTYDSPDAVYEIVRAAPEPLRGMMDDLIEMRLADPMLPMEDALRQNLAGQGMEGLPDEQFAVIMNALYPVDAYVRDYFRKAALDALVLGGVPVSVMGTGWEKYKPPNGAGGGENPRVEPQMMFGPAFERIARASVILDVSPIFPRGVHDRVLAGMANRAAVLTDENPYISEHFKDGREVCLYSLTDLSTLVGRANELLSSRGRAEEIAEAAFSCFERGHTWRHRAAEILSWADGAGQIA